MAETSTRKVAVVDSDAGTAEHTDGVATEKATAYWKENIRLILTLLAIWALVSYGAGYALAIPLSNVFLGNVPLSFWIVQQGSIVVFVILIFVYAIMMDRLDKKYDV